MYVYIYINLYPSLAIIQHVLLLLSFIFSYYKSSGSSVYEKLIKCLMEAGYLVVLFGAVPLETKLPACMSEMT